MAVLKMLKRLSPCMILLLIIGICQYNIVVMDRPIFGFLRNKLTFTSKPRDLERIPSKPVGPVRVLVISYARTGSSFVGDILQSYPGSFYYFEPVHFLEDTAVNISFPEAKLLLQNLLECQVTKVPGFLRWQKSHPRYMKLRRHTRYWVACSRTNSCYNSTFLDQYCSKHSAVVVKTIRLSLKYAARILEELPDLNLKIVYLSRDPRGTLSSRNRNSIKFWCKRDPVCGDINAFCERLHEDSQIVCKLLSSRPNDFTIVRYEDLSREPYVFAIKLAKFIGYNSTKEIGAFLNTHTIASMSAQKAADGLNALYNTFRNSALAATRWRREVSFDEALKQQNVCAKPIDFFGYHIYNDSSFMKSDINFDKDLLTSLANHCSLDVNVT